ncbi:polyketide synthase [Nemania abortiva]|nr:polyketide synthase [Nemania abortiva]
MDPEPICLVSMACRLPGDIHSPSDLWKFLDQNKSAQGKVPPERFNIDGFYHQDGSRAGVMDADGGYFLNEDVRLFDNAFFGINAMEATYMDPQQRKLLEVVYECFETTGLSMSDVSGANIGVFVGNFTVDYQTMQTRDPDYMHRYNATGSGTAILSNRISHVFNLQGPSMTIDTACSSSIYCLHNAVTAIRNGDCDSAIVAGANLIISPEQHLGTMKGGVLSPTSTCHTFDASADGYGRAEGVNAVYIKTLSSAIRDGNKIWSVIRSTAVNANGKTLGITQPSALMQEKVIRRAYAKAGLSFDDTDYIECHGTGTAVGDPIEVEALQACFAPRNSPLIIGSVKSNLGHSEAASGLTSLIKVAMSFEMGKIPPTYGLRKLNPRLNLSKANMRVLKGTEDWPRPLRRASINSFGYGGANAHAVVESFNSFLEDPPRMTNGFSKVFGRVLLVPFSAGSDHSLALRKREIAGLLECADIRSARSMTFTLTQQRPLLHARDSLIIKDDGAGLVEPVESTAEVVDPSSKGLPFAFIFTGQGAQYPQMGKDLFQNNGNFRRVIRKLDAVLRSLPCPPSWSIEQTILDEPGVSNIDNVRLSQPVCTAIQIGLVDLLQAWNVQPSAVVGHSSGEIAAAYAAGLLTMEQAVLIAFFRGLAASDLTEPGRMIAAGMEPKEASQLIAELGLENDISVACVNSPVSVTLSGSQHAADRVFENLTEKKVFARKLTTGGRAYHSHLVKRVGQTYEDMLHRYLENTDPPARSGILMFSSVGYESGCSVLSHNQAAEARYWRDNLEKSVQFSDAVQALLAASGESRGYHFIEIGPHSALKGAIRQICVAARVDAKRFPYSPTFLRTEDSELAIMKLANSLYLHGHILDWQSVNPISPHDRVIRTDIPPYSWDYSAGLHWYESRLGIELRNRKYPRHELLGSAELGGNGIDWTWRNILRLNEAGWLQDHKIEEQVVFPAVGYLAMAMEALRQTLGVARHLHGEYFVFRDVAITAALVVDTKPNTVEREVELHTTMSTQKISNASTSKEWHQFAISSWVGGQATLHCSGIIGLSSASLSAAQRTHVRHKGEFEKWNMKEWYRKLSNEGLRFGPTFRSLTSLETDRNRMHTEAISHTALQTKVGQDTDTLYPIHPVTIDACFQAAIMGSTAGNIDDLRAFMPVSIAHCSVDPSCIDRNQTQEAKIYSTSVVTGPSTKRVSCTLVGPEGNTIVSMADVRLSLYTGNLDAGHAAMNPHEQRHPALRISWEPDILRLPAGPSLHLDKYIADFAKRNIQEREHKTLRDVSMVVMLHLVGHYKPSCRILEVLPSDSGIRDYLLRWLNPSNDLPRLRSWDQARLSGSDLEVTDNVAGPFDIVVMSEADVADSVWKYSTEQMLSLLGESGIILSAKTARTMNMLDSAHFSITEIAGNVVLGVKQTTVEHPIHNKDVTIIYTRPTLAAADFADSLSQYLIENGATRATKAPLAELSSLEISSKTIYISLCELEYPLLATMSMEEMSSLQRLTNTAKTLLWITGAYSLSSSPNADLTLANGLSRALMLEQPSLRFSILDVGRLDALDFANTFDNVLRALKVLPGVDDKEFVQVEDILYNSRFVPDARINSLFRRRMRHDNPVQDTALNDAGRAQLAISRPGVTDTIYFQQAQDVATAVPTGFVDVEIKAVSLNAKDVYTLSGHAETKNGTSALEFCGIVREVGPDVENPQVGDRVVVMAPNHFTTVERVPAWSAQRMEPNEEFGVLCTIPIAYSTALYALQDRGHLRAGESVLIHAGAGAFGTAAINIAQLVGATVYATCSSELKRQHLINELHIPLDRIFNSRGTSFAEDVRQATGGRGVDLVINSLVGDLMHASWECLANFGRFVEVGKRELVDGGRLQMGMFLKNTTFTAFDLSELFYHEDQYYRDIWIAKMKQALELYRAGSIKAGPIAKYDVSQISQAFRAFSVKDRIGKIVVSLENRESLVPLAPSKYLTTFNSEKIYLLIGCLGGLGRSLSHWMLKRGARHFAFLGRSGDDKLGAKELLSHLRKNGAQAIVVRGDVSAYADVQSAVEACLATGRAIGGTVQAAMGLSEALFSQMSNKDWHTAVQPKWVGTWNLHHALAGHEDDLDFFLLTSSVSGSVATATESNYCAANGFLDAWARWRRSQGKKAVSVGLGMISDIGYLHENPEIEQLLLRKGIQPLTEEEYLQVIDLALSGEGGDFSGSCSIPSSAHMLTGLESAGLRKLADQGWDIGSGNLDDPRCGVLAASLLQASLKSDTQTGVELITDAPPWLQSVSPAVANALASELHMTSLVEAVLQITRKRFSALILMPVERIDIARSLAEFGVDSMIAAEFRTWIWTTFRVDIPFLDLLSKQKTLSMLSGIIAAEISSIDHK